MIYSLPQCFQWYGEICYLNVLALTMLLETLFHDKCTLTLHLEQHGAYGSITETI